MNSTNRTRKRLVRSVSDEILSITEQNGIDIDRLPKSELEKWVCDLVRLRLQSKHD